MIGHPAPLHKGESEVVIMIAVGIEEMDGSDWILTPTIRSEPRLESAKPSTRAKWRSFSSARRSVPEIRLTPPTLLSRWEKLGRGGTEDETVKLLDEIQRV